MSAEHAAAVVDALSVLLDLFGVKYHIPVPNTDTWRGALSEWMKETNRTQRALAKEVGCGFCTTSQWLSGIRPGSVEHRLKIEAISNGRVRADLPPAPRGKGRPRKVHS
jgi:hypothetical protein